MRRRELSPGFFKSEQLADCSMAARLLFEGLWCLADREGRLEDRPRRIKAEVFPHDALDVDPLLGELSSAGLVQRYEVDGLRLLAIPKFARHQHPHFKEAGSTYPGPGEHLPRSVPAPTQARIDPSVTGPTVTGPTGPTGISATDVASPEQAPVDFVAEVVAAYQGTLTPKRLILWKLTPKRRDLIRSRVRTHGLDTVIAACLGWPNDPWPERVAHSELETILAVSEKRDNVSKFAAMHFAPPQPVIAEDEQTRRYRLQKLDRERRLAAETGRPMPSNVIDMVPA